MIFVLLQNTPLGKPIIGITFGISCLKHVKAASQPIRWKPLQFKVSEGQVGQESNLQPAVLETQSGVSGSVGWCRHMPLCPTLAVV